MSTKTVEVHLPYFKQGDDLGYFLNQCNNSVSEAMFAHAEMMQDAVEELSALGVHLENVDVKNIEACDHYICFTLPEETADILIEKGLVIESLGDEFRCDCVTFSEEEDEAEDQD